MTTNAPRERLNNIAPPPPPPPPPPAESIKHVHYHKGIDVMGERLEARVAPFKEKRWIVVTPLGLNDRMYEAYLQGRKDNVKGNKEKFNVFYQNFIDGKWGSDDIKLKNGPLMGIHDER